MYSRWTKLQIIGIDRADERRRTTTPAAATTQTTATCRRRRRTTTATRSHNHRWSGSCRSTVRPFSECDLSFFLDCFDRCSRKSFVVFFPIRKTCQLVSSPRAYSSSFVISPAIVPRRGGAAPFTYRPYNISAHRGQGRILRRPLGGPRGLRRYLPTEPLRLLRLSHPIYVPTLPFPQRRHRHRRR